ncbi:MAG: PqqD family protein [Desulfobacteraceae bacterium]|nr:PqqD family protein [Desulfobacteraceae bacterium]MBC2757816.1 PqqD family protein [Desulfobacteraceae bacterium]
MDKVFQKVEGIVVRKVVGETILVPISGNLADMQRIFALNPVAEFIWERLDGQTPVNGIYNGILNNFEIDQDQAENDLVDFIDKLKIAQLIM